MKLDKAFVHHFRKVALMTIILMAIVFIGAKCMSRKSWEATFGYGIGVLYLFLTMRDNK